MVRREAGFVTHAVFSILFLATLTPDSLAKVKVWRLYAGPPLPPAEAALVKVAHGTGLRLIRVNGAFSRGADVMHMKPGVYVLACEYLKEEFGQWRSSVRRLNIRFTAEAGHEYLVSAFHPHRLVYSPSSNSSSSVELVSKWAPVVTDLGAKVQYFAPGLNGSVVRVREGKITFVAPEAEDHPHLVAVAGDLPVPVEGDFSVGEEASPASANAGGEVVGPLSPAHRYSVARIENRCQEPVPPEYLELLRWHVEEGLYYRNLLAVEGEKPTRVIALVVTQFRMRADVSRTMVGILAGKDKIVSTVTVKDALNDKVLTQAELESSNPSARGTAETVAETHAKAVLRLVEALPE